MPPTRRTSVSSSQLSKTPSCSSTSKSTTWCERGAKRARAKPLKTHLVQELPSRDTHVHETHCCTKRRALLHSLPDQRYPIFAPSLHAVVGLTVKRNDFFCFVVFTNCWSCTVTNETHLNRTLCPVLGCLRHASWPSVWLTLFFYIIIGVFLALEVAGGASLGRTSLCGQRALSCMLYTTACVYDTRLQITGLCLSAKDY